MAAPASALAQAGGPLWLDAPLRQWNAAGGTVPTAPRRIEPFEGRCTGAERPPAGPEESALAAAGWRMTDFWPSQRGGALVLVTAAAGYDGMCRPAWFNAFAFGGGRYAGTAAPQPMYPREDGTLYDRPAILAGGLVEATYLRYAATDPLCCPSLPATAVTYRLQSDAAGPVLLASRVAVALRLPATGGGPAEEAGA